MFKRIGNVIRNFKDMELDELAGIKYFLFFLIVADLFGVYWFLEQKKLAIAFLICIVFFLGFILFIEREVRTKMTDKEETKEEKKEEEKKETKEEEKKDKKEEKSLMEDMIPSDEAMRDAIGL